MAQRSLGIPWNLLALIAALAAVVPEVTLVAPDRRIIACFVGRPDREFIGNGQQPVLEALSEHAWPGRCDDPVLATVRNERMSLTAQFSDEFDSAIRQRGADYFRNSRVRIDSASASCIVATVKGSSRYRVELEREGRKIHASCTCPYADVDLCKHLWAVILAAEKQRLLQGEGFKLVHRGIEDDGLDDEFDEDYEDEDYDAGEDQSRICPPGADHDRTESACV